MTTTADALFDLALAVTTAESTFELAERTAAGVREVVGMDAASFNYVLPGEVSLVFSPIERLVPECAQAISRYTDDHPLIANFEQGANSGATSIDELVSRRSFLGSGLLCRGLQALRVHPGGLLHRPPLR